MTRYGMLAGRRRWCTAVCVVTLAVSLGMGAGAINADDPGTGLANNNGSLNPPPPTAVPSATPTTVPATATTAPPPGTSAGTAATPSGAAAPAGTPSASAAAGSPAAKSAPAASSDENTDVEEGSQGGGPRNVVKVVNKTDNRLRLKGKIQINHIPGADAEPVNDGEAYSSCTNCETFAVALQIDLISKSATTVAPKNTAIALNYRCSHCVTVTNAVQYVIQVDDPTQTPDNVKELIRQIQGELNAAAHTNGETAADVEARIKTVLAQFSDLAQSLSLQRDQNNDDDTPGATAPPDAVALTPTPDESTPAATDTPVASGTPTP